MISVPPALAEEWVLEESEAVFKAARAALDFKRNLETLQGSLQSKFARIASVDLLEALDALIDEELRSVAAAIENHAANEYGICIEGVLQKEMETLYRDSKGN